MAPPWPGWLAWLALAWLGWLAWPALAWLAGLGGPALAKLAALAGLASPTEPLLRPCQNYAEKMHQSLIQITFRRNAKGGTL